MNRARLVSRKVSTRSQALLLDPLRPDRIAKSQALSSFPKPQLVLFDLWGTLYTPKAPVPVQYHQISSGEFGLDKLAESIAAEFPAVFAQMEKEYPNYGKLSTNITLSDQWWLQLICKLYGLDERDPEAQRMCVRLLDHFKSSEAYVLYDDVVPVLETLRQRNVRVVASSNSDHRALAILASLGVGHYFGDNVNLSYDIGHAKPSRAFFRAVSDKYYRRARARGLLLGMGEYLERVWHVGDHYEKDFVGAVKAGWNGVLLDRQRSSVFFANPQKKEITNDCFEGQGETLDGDDLVMIANNRVCVSGLSELPRLFEA